MNAETFSAIRLVQIPRSTLRWTSHSAPHCGSTTLRHCLRVGCPYTLLGLRYLLCVNLAIGSWTTITGLLQQRSQIGQDLALPHRVWVWQHCPNLCERA